MRDRIAVFRAQVEDQEANEGRSTVIDVAPDTNVQEVKEFLKKSHQIRDKLVNIENLVTQIRDYHRKIYGAASRNEEVHTKLNQAMDEIRALFDTVKNSLKEMEQQSSDIEKREGASRKRPADIRIMSSQYMSLQCWFFETWTEYNECQCQYRERCKEKLTRQIQITEKKVTPEEINDMIESGNFTVFSYNAQFQQKDIEELKSRQNDITKLAESLKALHEMFKDLNLMVEQQGEMLNNIERNVENAKEYVGDAERNCQMAVDYTRKIRKKKLICALVIIAIFVIIGAVIAIVVHINKST